MTGQVAAQGQRQPDRDQASDVLGALRRHAPLILILATLGGASAALIGGLRSESYQVSALLLFGSGGSELQILGAPGISGGPASEERDVANNAALLRSPRVAEEAARRLGRPDEDEEIADAVEVRPQEDADVVEVAVKADSPEEAVEIANTYARTFRALQVRDQAEAARQAAEALTDRLSALSPAAARGVEGQSLGARIAQLRALERVGTGSPRIIDAAETGEVSKQGGGSTSLIALGAMMGLALGAGVALVRQQSDRRLRRNADLEEAFGAPVLAAVPRSRSLRRHVPFAKLAAADSEGFRILAAKVAFADRGKQVQGLLVTSAREGEGKSTIAWYLACAIAASGLRVVLVEADLRRPELARRFGLDGSQGLAQVVAGEVEPREVLQRVLVETRAGQERPRTVDVLPSGPAVENPATLAQSSRLTDLIDDLREHYDVVVTDTAPIMQVADTIPLAKQADGVLIAARVAASTSQDAEAVSRQLGDLGARVLGVVANGGKSERDPGYGTTLAARGKRG